MRKKIKLLFLSLFMLCFLLAGVGTTYAAGYEKPAGYIYWNTAKTNAIKLSGGNYYRITDLASYGINTSISTYYGKTYDVMQYSTPSRVTYQKPFEVTYNTTVSLISGTDGEANNVNQKSIAWCVIEYDADGNLLYDGNWMSTSQSHCVGVTTGGDDHSYGTRSTRVRYISLVFRYIEGGDFNVGVESPNMTPAELASHFPNLYVHYKPFTYTIVNSNVHTIWRTGTAAVSLSPYVEMKAGYTFNGWKITSDSTIMPNWMNGNTYSHSQVEAWLLDGKFYNSLFGNVTFTAIYTPNSYTVEYNANGGTTTAMSKEVTYGERVDLSPTASKDGYTFIGWSTSSTARIPLSTYSMPEGNVTLYAVYSIKVSDVENHDYPAYTETPNKNNDEVFLKVWIKSEPSVCNYYPLIYSKDVNMLVYRYTLPTTDISDFVSGREYAYQLIAYDNAGNEAILYDGSGGAFVPPEPKRYIQTVKHYKYHPIKKIQVLFDVATIEAREGDTFEPSYVTPPTGYYASSKDAGGIVSEAKTYNAFYYPNTYILTFDANGGLVTPETKEVTYDDYYGTLPIPSRTGYTFLGWNTESNGTGTMINEGDICTTAGNQILYAQWSINAYTVIYDYWTNGGNRVGKESALVNFNADVDLSVTAEKGDDFTFVGWNTDAGAINGLDSLTMGTEDVTLYAIFAKEINVTLVEKDGEDTVETVLSKTIYNNANEAEFSIVENGAMTGWDNVGWSDKCEATAEAIVFTDEKFFTCHSIRLFALYASDVMVSYDTNGSDALYESVTKKRFYNAAGDYFYPVFDIASAPNRENHSFVIWESEDGIKYSPDRVAQIKESTLLTAIWDQFPMLDANDRYFTLEQAQNGLITQSELLRKVTATDMEDGELERGVDVIVKNYRADMFEKIEGDTELTITYQAKDSYGNVLEKKRTVFVVDTAIKKTVERYVRFINAAFFCDADNHLISAEEGGLEETSIWRKNEDFLSLLRKALSKDESNKETWFFTAEELRKKKEMSPAD